MDPQLGWLINPEERRVHIYQVLFRGMLTECLDNTADSLVIEASFFTRPAYRWPSVGAGVKPGVLTAAIYPRAQYVCPWFQCLSVPIQTCLSLPDFSLV